MDRRTLLQGLAGFAAISALGGYPTTALAASPSGVSPTKRPAAFWRDKVSPAAFAVLFNDGTERAGSSALDKEKRAGTYVCAACHLPLFDGRHKYDSGTGWPSFTQPIAGRIRTRPDRKLPVLRTEYHCARCGGHQGHVFDDGPSPRGERWCNNGVALRFVPQGERLPMLRG